MANNKKINIAIIGHSFLGWNGGVDFIERIVSSLAIVAHDESVNLFYILPNKKKLNFFSKIILRLKILVKMILRKNYDKVLAKLSGNFLSKQDLERQFGYFSDKVKLVFISGKENKFGEYLKQLNINFTLFADQNLDDSIPNISYYPDLQHKYLTNFFSPEEIKLRDAVISRLLTNSPRMIVNANDVRDDLHKFFPQEAKKCQIFALPFAPMLLNHQWLEDLNYDVLKKYNLPKKYFLISNQLWIHKNHITAVRALKLLLESNPEISIVCTGSTFDYRFPEYFAELKKQIKEMNLEEKILFLGLIDRRDQIEILKKSIALIQPTLFEGAPGGGAFYDAVSVGARTIISDIKVNFEARGIENNFYFKAQDADDLCIKMREVLQNNLQQPSNEKLIKNSKDRSCDLGKQIIKIIRELN